MVYIYVRIQVQKCARVFIIIIIAIMVSQLDTKMMMKLQYPRPQLPLIAAFLSACLLVQVTTANTFQFGQNFGHQLQSRYRQSLDKYNNVWRHRAFPAAGSAESQGLRVEHKRSALSGGSPGSLASEPAVENEPAQDDSFLQIKEAPPKLLEARQHGKTVLECSAAGSPAPRVTWYKDGRPVNSGAYETSYRSGSYSNSLAITKAKITLGCVDEQDAGFYECVASQQDGQRTQAVGTEVHVVSFGSGCYTDAKKAAPAIYQHMETFMMEMGNEAHLICHANGPHATKWIGPNEKPVIEGKKYKILANGDLLIKDLTFEDMGMFQCIVKNKYGHDMAETFVYPLAPM